MTPRALRPYSSHVETCQWIGLARMVLEAVEVGLPMPAGSHFPTLAADLLHAESAARAEQHPTPRHGDAA